MKSKTQLFYRPPKVDTQPVPQEVPTTPISEIPKIDWRDKYAPTPELNTFKSGNFADDTEINTMIQLKSFENINLIEGKPGRLYYDKTNKKVKIFIDKATGWADINYTPET
jgi:hypothetical protein